MTRASGTADVVICGAGIAGIAAAYYLTHQHGINDVVLIDERPPLTLTSDKSSEGYRNWWPGPGSDMIRFMDRSIDLLDALAAESGNRFHLNRRGYVYLTADSRRVEAMQQEAAEIAHLGAGLLRLDGVYEAPSVHSMSEHLRGADLVRDPARIQARFPFLTKDTTAMLHARRCGWMSAQQLGMYLLEQSRAAGARLLTGRVTGVNVSGNHIKAIEVRSNSGSEQIATGSFVIAAGPLIAEVAALLGITLPVYNEPHGKIAFEDTEGVIDRDAPMMIWTDPIYLPWNDEERAELAEHDDTTWLVNQFPPGLHFRPEGGPGSQTILALWPYHIEQVDRPAWPLSFDPEFYDIVMRGLTRMIPGLAIYLEKMSRPIIDGGYYCKTRENRPLICPLPVSGAYLFGALSGFGIMAAPAGGELLAAHVSGAMLPSYAPAFDLRRYQDPHYQALVANWDPVAGQL